MSLEDDFCDIIKKARLGQSQSVEAVAHRSEISEQDLQTLEKGTRAPNQTEVQGLGSTLGLRSQPLIDIAINGWEPKLSPDWIRENSVVITIVGFIGGYAVKGYLLFDAKTNETAMIDTGYNAKEMLSTIKQRNLKLTAICLTHGHADHAGGAHKGASFVEIFQNCIVYNDAVFSDFTTKATAATAQLHAIHGEP